MTDGKYIVNFGNQWRDVPTTAESAIVGLPKSMYVEIEGEKTLDLVRLMAYLRKTTRKIAAALPSDVLHHAEWMITRDAKVVQEVGVMHDCARCRAGTDQALAAIKAEPELELLVGICYWIV